MSETKERGLTVKIDADASGLEASLDSAREKVRLLNEELATTVALVKAIDPASVEEQIADYIKTMGWG